MTWTPEERAYVDAVAKMAAVALDGGRYMPTQRADVFRASEKARVALEAAQAPQPGLAGMTAADVLGAPFQKPPSQRAEIVVTDEMLDAGYVAWGRGCGSFYATIARVYRAMRAAESKPT